MCRTQRVWFLSFVLQKTNKEKWNTNHTLQCTISDIRFAVFHIQEEATNSEMENNMHLWEIHSSCIFSHRGRNKQQICNGKPQVQDIHIQRRSFKSDMENCTYERFTLLVEEATDLKWQNHKYEISNIHIYRKKKLSNLTWTTTSMMRDSPLLVA